MTTPVDREALVEAFTDASPALDYYVDRETGEVVLVSETLGFIEAGLQRAEMAEHPGRYAAVPIAGQSELADDLEAFIDALDDEPLQNELDELLDAPDPAKALAGYLSKRDDLAAAWVDHRRDRFRSRAERWASAHGFAVQ